jgi:hypothetical protein
MRRGDETHRSPDAQVVAAERVEAAATERSRVCDEREVAKGTSKELQAQASLQAADDQLAARERWLRWVEDGDY